MEWKPKMLKLAVKEKGPQTSAPLPSSCASGEDTGSLSHLPWWSAKQASWGKQCYGRTFVFEGLSFLNVQIPSLLTLTGRCGRGLLLQGQGPACLSIPSAPSLPFLAKQPVQAAPREAGKFLGSLAALSPWQVPHWVFAEWAGKLEDVGTCSSVCPMEGIS